MKLRGRCINPGKAEGEAIVSHLPFSFKGEIDPHTGMIPSPSHEHFGRSLKDKILICPSGKGSSENTNVAYEAKLSGVAPAAIVVQKMEPVLAACVLVADIPTLEVNQDVFELIKTGDRVKVDAHEGYLEILK
jgi:predicted aconitase with swiveling domain